MNAFLPHLQRSASFSMSPVQRIMGTLACVLLATPGCSFMATSAPSYPNGGQEPVCNDGYGMPILDAVATVAGLGMIIDASGSCDDLNGLDESVCSGFSSALIGLVAIPTAIYAISTVTGFENVSSCVSAKQAYSSRPSPGDPVAAGKQVESEAPSRTESELRSSEECQAHRARLQAAGDPAERLAIGREIPPHCF